MDTNPQTRPPIPEACGKQPRGAASAQAPALPAQRQSDPTPTPALRRAKADALRIASRLKRGAAVAAMLGFGVFGVTIGSHLATTSATTTTSSSETPSSSSPSSSSSSGGFLGQQSGGSSFSSSSSSSSSTPVTSTGVS